MLYIMFTLSQLGLARRGLCVCVRDTPTTSRRTEGDVVMFRVLGVCRVLWFRAKGVEPMSIGVRTYLKGQGT